MYPNIPQISAKYEDGNFDTVSSSLQPKILILGTASDGRTDALWQVGRVNQATKEFKGYGTLIRGMYEVLTQGADNVWLGRLATGIPGALTGIGAETAGEGITIETVQEDDDVGVRYALWFTVSTGRLAIYDNEDEEWIYDSEEILAIDEGRISVSGSFTVGEGVEIGTQSSPVNFEDCPDLDVGVIEWVDGTDGTEPSLMELYEALEIIYNELDWQDMDFVVPMGATINATNVADLSSGEITSRDLASLTDYPVKDSQQDVLGKVYIQEYQGEFYFWWDTDGDSVAEIYPSVGSATSTTNIKGETLTASDFHEVNFAYQLAEFCRKASTTWHCVQGFIGTTGPEGFDKSSLSNWIGDLPTYTELTDGSVVVATTSDNGTGLLGNKFMAGKKNFRSSLKDGGFIQTEEGFLDGTELEDSNEHVVDIGKHIIVPFQYVIHLNQYINPTSSTGKPTAYLAGTATTLAGKYATLPEKEEANGPNGLLRGIRIDGIKIPGRLLDKLLGVRYVGVRVEPGIGVIACGSKTAARTDSDWTKISTIRSVNREIQGLRSIVSKYLGKEFSPQMILSIKTSCEGFLKEDGSLGYNNGAKFDLSFTTAQRRLGQATIQLKMVPPFAFEAIDIVASLSDDESSL